MTTVSRESVTQLMAEQRAQFEKLQRDGEVSAQSAALFEGLFTLLQMVVTLLLEKNTRKTSATSSLPGSLTPFDRTAKARKGARSKGPKHKATEPDNVRHEISEHISPVNECQRCGEDLSDVAPADHQQRVLIDIEFVCVEKRISAEIKHCPACAKVSCGPFPEQMPGPLQYGSGLIAFATDLVIAQMVPLRRTVQMLRMMIARTVSEATVLKWIMRLNHALAEWESVAIEQLLAMPVMHVDETSIRVNAKKHWIHSCSGGDVVVKKCHPKRGAEAVEAIHIIPRFGDRGSGEDDSAHKPVLIHDRWATCFMYDKCDHGLCGAHLLRNLKHIEQALGHRWASEMRGLLIETCKEVSETDVRKLSRERFEHVAGRYDAILEQGRSELPVRPQRQGRKGRLPKSEAEKLHDAFVGYKTEILRFARQSEVPFTNNRSERDIRMAKIKQRVSGTFRNADHAQAYCRISSYLQTMSNQGYNSLAAVQIALNGNAANMLRDSK